MENSEDKRPGKGRATDIKSRLTRRSIFALSLILLLHFAVPLFFWFAYVWDVCTTDKQVIWPYLLHCVPAVVLFSISLAAFILVLLKKRNAGKMLLLAVVLSACCFIYETRYDKWCYGVRPIVLNGPEPYQGLGYRYYFVNWWWYEKDIVRSGDFTTDKVFHHFFGIRPKGYSSGIFIGLPDPNGVRDDVEK
jgi:hypothetical protein